MLKKFSSSKTEKLFLNQLNPIFKLLFLIMILVCGTKISSIFEASLLLVIVWSLILISKIPIVYFHRQIKFIVYFWLIFFGLGFFAEVHWTYYFFIIVKFYVLFASIYLYIATTNINQFAEQLEILLRPIVKTKVREQFIFNLIMTINTIPILFNLGEQIKTAQQLRGIKLNILTYPYLLIPLLIQIDEVAKELNQTYQTRNLSINNFIGNTKWKYTNKDTITLIILAIVIIIEIIWV